MSLEVFPTKWHEFEELMAIQLEDIPYTQRYFQNCYEVCQKTSLFWTALIKRHWQSNPHAVAQMIKQMATNPDRTLHGRALLARNDAYTQAQHFCSDAGIRIPLRTFHPDPVTNLIQVFMDEYEQPVFFTSVSESKAVNENAEALFNIHYFSLPGQDRGVLQARVGQCLSRLRGMKYPSQELLDVLTRLDDRFRNEEEERWQAKKEQEQARARAAAAAKEREEQARAKAEREEQARAKAEREQTQARAKAAAEREEQAKALKEEAIQYPFLQNDVALAESSGFSSDQYQLTGDHVLWFMKKAGVTAVPTEGNWASLRRTCLKGMRQFHPDKRHSDTAFTTARFELVGKFYLKIFQLLDRNLLSPQMGALFAALDALHERVAVLEAM
jgi:hypothetical protein